MNLVKMYNAVQMTSPFKTAFDAIIGKIKK